MFLCIIFLVLIVCEDYMIALPVVVFSRPWTRWSRSIISPIFMLWLVKIWQVSLCGKFMQHLETCLLWQLKLTEFCVNLWCFYCLFPLDVRNEIQLLSRVFCYSWLVCLLGFWLRNMASIRFRFSPCLIEKSEAIVPILDSFQDLHLER